MRHISYLPLEADGCVAGDWVGLRGAGDCVAVMDGSVLDVHSICWALSQNIGTGHGCALLLMVWVWPLLLTSKHCKNCLESTQ